MSTFWRRTLFAVILTPIFSPPVALTVFIVTSGDLTHTAGKAIFSGLIQAGAVPVDCIVIVLFTTTFSVNVPEIIRVSPAAALLIAV